MPPRPRQGEALLEQGTCPLAIAEIDHLVSEAGEGPPNAVWVAEAPEDRQALFEQRGRSLVLPSLACDVAQRRERMCLAEQILNIASERERLPGGYPAW